MFPFVAQQTIFEARDSIFQETKFIASNSVYFLFNPISIREMKSWYERRRDAGSSNDRLRRLYFKRLSAPRRAHSPSTRKILRNYGRRILTGIKTFAHKSGESSRNPRFFLEAWRASLEIISFSSSCVSSSFSSCLNAVALPMQSNTAGVYVRGRSARGFMEKLVPFPRVFKGIPWLDRDKGDRLEPLPLDPPTSRSNPPSNGERYLSKYVPLFEEEGKDGFFFPFFSFLDLSIYLGSYQ